MLSQVSRFLSSEGLVSYFLPGTIFALLLVAAPQIARWGGLDQTLVGELTLMWFQIDVVNGARMYWETLVSRWEITAFLTLGVGFLLQLLEYPISRALEGYWPERKARRQVEQFQRLSHEVEALEGSEDPATERTRARMRRTLKESFPPERHLVLPTRFGNIYRAFELYSYTVYGLDAVPAWPRLMGVVGEESLAEVEKAKSTMSFFMNTTVLLGAASGGFALVGLWQTDVSLLTVALPVAGLSYFAYKLACGAVKRYGDTVKAAFDVYRLDLLKKLGFARPTTREEEKEAWARINQMFVYQYTHDLPPYARVDSDSDSDDSSGSTEGCENNLEVSEDGDARRTGSRTRS